MSREAGIRGKQLQREQKSRDEMLAEQMMAAAQARMRRPPPPAQLATIPVDPEGLPVPSDDEMRKARERANTHKS
jgi:hypothetical protein